ncbi:MAG: Hsp20 family protein [Planctomycetales bacterium]|nr:Hsp20 family protein [Planctomycetales bacterium]NIM09978.1 Hsp20 family protein [Planctomycetales bacterium]NIN09416.1 Hsp20 family protein [Planctomycetales bacterium]NIP05594.1 Hsp20 family protein [Planctomycetales bacterium]
MIPPTDRFGRLMNRMEEELEGLWDRFGGGDEGWLTPPRFVPTVDVVEAENQFEVTVDLPGLKPEEVNVELHEGELWISGKREEKKEEKGKTYHRIERRHGEFRRVFPLPSTINEEAIEAKFENGVLKVTVPKTEEAKPKHIEVKA